ncbi:MAG: mechanosensitive ion channel family protein [Acidobacteriia bacterium]|nr:mechanosensitive ion channel family protein [Terriglobia bacterium]
MKRLEKLILWCLAALVAIALGAVIFTNNWANYRERVRALRLALKRPADLIDTRALDSAQQLAQLAVTHTEQDYAQQALRLADHSVDLAFAAAMYDAAENPPPLTPEMNQLAARIRDGEAAVAADQNRITQFTAALAAANGSAKDDLQQLIGIAQAQIALDQDDLEDAQQDMIRAGGNRKATIQQLLDQRKASSAPSALMPPPAPAGAAPSIELTKARNTVAEVRAWSSLRSKEALLVQAQQEASARAAKLSAAHDALEAELAEGKPQKENAPGAAARPEADSPLARLRQQTEAKKNLAEFDKHIETEKQLAAVYGNWIELVNAREKGFLHEILVSVFSILTILLLVLLANYWVRRFFEGISLERRQMHTMRAILLFAMQALGLILVLVVILGIPSNFATVLALAGAGLTVALKDFIVGFFGWFVLMGKDGIRPGDWVEINGVGGEVLKIGLLHTVILETGNWSDAGHPTGRKVSFVNSFAIEGHYFNFSTSGQWLWDEIEVLLPSTAEPYATAEAIRKIAADETSANANLAETEWNRVTPSYAKRSFSAAPSMSVRPTATGVNVVLRYLTRANERHEVRARLYHAIVELLHKR